MGIIVNKPQTQSELQQRITAELREKMAGDSQSGDFRAPEYDVNKSEYLKNTTASSVPGWVWITVLIVAAVAAFFIAQLIIANR